MLLTFQGLDITEDNTATYLRKKQFGSGEDLCVSGVSGSEIG